MLRIYWACGAEPPVDDATGLAGRAASMEIGAGLRMCAQRRCNGYPLRLGRLLQSRGMFRGLQTPAGLYPEFGLWSRGGEWSFLLCRLVVVTQRVLSGGVGESPGRLSSREVSSLHWLLIHSDGRA